MYADPMGSVGAGIGGLAGASAGAGTGLLSQAAPWLEWLDLPRQSLYNLVSGPLSGNFDAALPGLLGAATAFTPLGPLVGAIVAGAAQGIGNQVAPERFAAPSVSDLTGTEEMLPNMLVGALTDPLTYAGGIGGGRAGARAGRALGSRLEEGALIRGPNYPTDAAEMARILETGPTYQSRMHFKRAMENPELWPEIMPGSTIAGGGVESAFLRRPDAGGISIRPSSEYGEVVNSAPMDQPPPPRINIPEMLQAERSVAFPGSNPIRIEHVPEVATVPYSMDLPGQVLAYELRDQLARQGINFQDPHTGNIGLTRAGEVQVLDPGSIQPRMMGVRSAMGDEPGAMLPLASEIQRRPIPWWENALLRLLGSDEAVRAELAERLAATSIDRASPPIWPMAGGRYPDQDFIGTRLSPNRVIAPEPVPSSLLP